MSNGAGIVARTLREFAAANRIGIALSTLIIIAASVALFFLLRDIEVEKVIAAIRSAAPQTTLTAAGFVACAYLTLTGYDFFALRTIERREVPTASQRSQVLRAMRSAIISARLPSPRGWYAIGSIRRMV